MACAHLIIGIISRLLVIGTAWLLYLFETTYLYEHYVNNPGHAYWAAFGKLFLVVLLIIYLSFELRHFYQNKSSREKWKWCGVVILISMAAFPAIFYITVQTLAIITIV